MPRATALGFLERHRGFVVLGIGVLWCYSSNNSGSRTRRQIASQSVSLRSQMQWKRTAYKNQPQSGSRGKEERKRQQRKDL